MKRFPALFVFAFAAIAAHAGKYEDGMRYLGAGSYAQAASAFELAAARGNAAAERQLAFMHYRGQGFEQSDTAAAMWFERAATHGDLQSQVNLGQMYENGMSVPQSDTRSAYWYRLAADQGDRGSQFRVGEIYYLGSGIPRDLAEAVKWWRLAMRIEDERTARMLPTVGPALQKLPPELLAEGQRRAAQWSAEKAVR